MKKYNLDDIIDLTGKDKRMKSIVKTQKEGVELALNILEKKNYVLIADDVGMGKTYEALGLAFYKLSKCNKGFNILIVAPSNEVAEKWNKELKTFISKNWKDKKEIISVDDEGYYVKEIFDKKDKNKLKLNNVSEIDYKKNYITIINLKKFSYIKFNEDDTDEKIIEQLKTEKEKLPQYDLVIIDESQNLRRHESKKSRFFSALFGLKNEGDLKFEKVVFLTATPNHSCKNDILSQLLYIDPNIIENKINTQIISNSKNLDKDIAEGKFIIKRHRKYDGKNKYEFREFMEYNANDMSFQEMLTMALIQKRQIAKKDGVFKMGYIDGFESFINNKKIEEDENTSVPDYYLHDRNKLDDKYYIDDLYNSIDKFSEKNSLDISKLLTHPKPRLIRKMLETTKLEEIEKVLIFVRRVSSIEEIEKQLISNFDNDIQKLVNEIDADIQGVESLKNKLSKIIKKDDNNEYEENGQEDEEINEENVKSIWLENLESKKVDNKETSIFNKVKIKFQSGLDNKYYNFFEPKVLNYFFDSHEEIKNIYKENKEEIDKYILRYKANLKLEKMRRFHKIRAFTAGILEFMSKTDKRYENIYNNYVEIMNLEKLKKGKLLDTDITGIDSFYIDFQSKKNFWDIDYFKYSILNKKNKELDSNLFIKQLKMKKFIEKNLLNGEGMIYLLAIISKISKNYKSNKIGIEEILKEINSDKSIFKKRIIFRIEKFIKNYDQEEKQFKKLKIDKSYFKNPITGASGRTSIDERIKIQNLFNTSFYPDILISSDIFNEGIDLHLFCSRIINYGIAWLPGDMEQRIGRIDRLFCKAYRDYDNSDPKNTKQIKVDFIHMDDEMDKRQISKILGRMINSIKELELPKDRDKSKEVDCKEERNEIAEKIEILNNIGEKLKVGEK